MADTEKSTLRLGLALSGGGYRAAAFHLGTLRALNTMNILKRVNVLSTVSGGSIVGADYALASKSKTYQAFEDEFIRKLKKGVIKRILTSRTFILIVLFTIAWIGGMIYFQFTCYPWVSWIMALLVILMIIFFQFKIFPVSAIIEGIYDRIFFDGNTLPDLPEEPIMAINSTNLETGLQFTFSKNRMSDSSYDYPSKGEPIRFTTSRFPVARAVMASSCVPFAFTPVPIANRFFQNQDDTERVYPQLVDGGVFDNQGMHKLTFDSSSYSCDIVITSDAGDKMPFESSYKNVMTLLIRTMDVFMNRIKKFQMMDNMYQPGRNKGREIAFISLGWDLDKCIPGFVDNLRKNNIQQRVIDAHRIPKEYLSPFNGPAVQTYLEERLQYGELKKRLQPAAELEVARNVGTNLTALSDRKINALINQSELMTELQVKLYCPTILISQA
jgi:NTE family protein